MAGAKFQRTVTMELGSLSRETKYDLKDYTIPGDFSSASYLLAAAALTDKSKLQSKIYIL